MMRKYKKLGEYQTSAEYKMKRAGQVNKKITFKDIIEILIKNLKNKGSGEN